MLKIVLLCVVILSLVSCANNARVENKADSLKVRVDTTLDRLGDSAKAKGVRTLEAIKEKVNEIGTKTDSAEKDSIR